MSRRESDTAHQSIIDALVKERDIWKTLADSLGESVQRQDQEIQELRMRVREPE